jgi:ATP-dependent helicase Lhr and Lhr-like helicase
MAPLPLTLELHPAVRAWFEEHFPEGPTPPQAEGWPLVQGGSDVLIAAPTGSGKTLAGFLMAINEAYQAHGAGALVEGRTRVVYVSPLKALAVDVHENLQRPLAQIAERARALGLPPAPVTVAVRTGDTTSSARASMIKGPPTILVTTPESFYLYLTAERSRQTLADVRTVIIDEIHALARDKRGSHLALSLERLDAAQAEGRPQRVGLSATQRPIEVMARFLAGAGASVHHSFGDGPPADGGLPEATLGATPPKSGQIGRQSPQSTGPAPARDSEGAEPAGRRRPAVPGPAPRQHEPASEPGPRHVEVVDCGHRRAVQVGIELPSQELAAVFSLEQLGEVVERIAEHVKGHRTTLVFVNTRRLSERLAHLLGELLGPEQVAAHHGSLSAERRKRTEARLRAGDLRALVATASLELGIDIGPVELVCQVGSPRAVSTFLQRVGRSNHSRHGVPEGIIFPTTRDELVECTALLAAVAKGRLDRVLVPSAPLDILAQQVIAEVAAAEECGEDDLYRTMSRAAPYDGLARRDFDAVVELASEGIPTGRGPRMAYIHRDRVNSVLRPRRGARLAALTSGGAIPEIGDYRVILEPEETVVGSVNEDFAIESMAGDVFLLGTHAWRIRRVTAGEVRVVDADGAPPSIPFWVGEAPSRTSELSEEVSLLRASVAEDVASVGPEQAALSLAARVGLQPDAAQQVVAYLATGLAQLGVMPGTDDIVFERFFDGAGGMQLVVHAPYWGRVNRALGLALRKRFCVSFDFELQAAASDDAVILSLGPQHSFPLSSAPKMLHPNTVRTTLEQAVLTSPMFASRWRWDLSRSLAILRFRGGRKNPLPVQRMEADDLMAAVFPALAACQENTPPGPVTLPDHVIVRQVLHDCLHEAMDIDGLEALVARLHTGRARAHFVDSVEPSVLAHEIVNSEPYTFLDDAPLEERRARQVQVRRGLPVEARDLSRLDPAALEKVRLEVAPAPRSADEVHDILLSVLLTRSQPDWEEWFAELAQVGRAMTVTPRAGAGGPLWCATERRPWAEALLPGAAFAPDLRLAGEVQAPPDPDQAAATAMRGHLGQSGPATVTQLAQRCALAPSRALVGLARLEAEGFAMRGRFDPDLGDEEQWCARHLLARLHGYTQNRLRREVKPVGVQDFVRFLLRWQHVAPGTRRQGRAGLLAVIEQLQGFQLAAGAWEESVLPARVENYQRRWLEDLCLSGEVTWGRLSMRPAEAEGQPRRGASTPSRATPVTFALRSDLPWLAQAIRGGAVPDQPAHGAARDVLDALRAQGAMFSSELPGATGRLPSEVQEGLWDLVARGIVTADGFAAVRALLGRRQAWARRHMPERRRLGLRPNPAALAIGRQAGEGRWAVLRTSTVEPLAGDELAEATAGQLLARWGVVFWDLSTHEDMTVPWREVLWALRRLEARGLVRGGRFVNGFAGEQYALPEALEELRHLARHPPDGQLVRLSGADPLNLSGVIIPGKRVAALRTNSILIRDGLPVGPGAGPDGQRTRAGAMAAGAHDPH